MSFTCVQLQYDIDTGLLAPTDLAAKVAAVPLTSVPLDPLVASIASDNTFIVAGPPAKVSRYIVLKFDNDSGLFPTNADKVAVCSGLYAGVLNTALSAAVVEATPVVVACPV